MVDSSENKKRFLIVNILQIWLTFSVQCEKSTWNILEHFKTHFIPNAQIYFYPTCESAHLRQLKDFTSKKKIDRVFWKTELTRKNDNDSLVEVEAAH